ncbi:bacterio-opsin activator domain-containing protein [Haloarculaceae archaeon H-GB2-1]|nr:bacterio-opsin activator domain-containing protein [Haloarculaceae archaeon H-GB1-1]MEA5389509.1 bacterio-opsin activator domain-containing protein [Haloarculaceae archaeon H-GB11]MEA5410037.1 bacterio-opsin activator domain-containing protein [Haloarculaceae archaeon H-GB2-1]
MRERRPIAAFEAAAELEFQVRDTGCFLVAESKRANCELVLDEHVTQSNGNVLQYVSVYGTSAISVLTDALDWPTVVDARIASETEDACLIELVVTGSCLSATVADSRAVPRLISATRGVGRVVVEVPPNGDPQRVIDVFRERHPDSDLVTRREHDVGPLFSDRLFEERILGRLTDRQRETLVTAYQNGYFDQPRRTTAVECARTLGISQSTFSQHLRVTLRKVLDELLPDPDPAELETSG